MALDRCDECGRRDWTSFAPIRRTRARRWKRARNRRLAAHPTTEDQRRAAQERAENWNAALQESISKWSRSLAEVTLEDWRKAMHRQS